MRDASTGHEPGSSGIYGGNPPGEHRLPEVAHWVPLLTETLQREGAFSWKVEGTSMEPTLPEGCEITLVPLPPTLRRGDLVLFAMGADLVVHRIVDRRWGQWITQGDNAALPEPPVPREVMVGRVSSAHTARGKVWPKRTSRLVALIWIARYHILRAIRFAGRFTTRI